MAFFSPKETDVKFGFFVHEISQNDCILFPLLFFNNSLSSIEFKNQNINKIKF
jgi:hypothetical protein